MLDKASRDRKPNLQLDAVHHVLDEVTQPRIGESRWSCRSMTQAAEISATSVHRRRAVNGFKSPLIRTFKLPIESPSLSCTTEELHKNAGRIVVHPYRASRERGFASRYAHLNLSAKNVLALRGWVDDLGGYIPPIFHHDASYVPLAIPYLPRSVRNVERKPELSLISLWALLSIKI